MSCFSITIPFLCDQNPPENQNPQGEQKPSEETLKDICRSIAVLVEGEQIFRSREKELIANYLYPVISDKTSARQKEISENFPKVMRKSLQNYLVHVIKNCAIVSVYFSWLSPYHQDNEKPLSTFLNEASLDSALSKTRNVEENRQVMTFPLHKESNHFFLTLEKFDNDYYDSDVKSTESKKPQSSQIYYIPLGIQKLKLKDFHLSHTKLRSLLPIKGLKQLETLEVPNNELESLPDFLCEFGKLKVLDVSNNCLKVLPEEIGKLTSLEKLSMGKNPLEAFPESFHQLKLKKLIVDKAQRALLEKVPSAILENPDCLTIAESSLDEKKT